MSKRKGPKDRLASAVACLEEAMREAEVIAGQGDALTASVRLDQASAFVRGQITKKDLAVLLTMPVVARIRELSWELNDRCGLGITGNI